MTPTTALCATCGEPESHWAHNRQVFAEHGSHAFVAPPAPSASATTEARCMRCKQPMDPSEARIFTVCSPCFDKDKPVAPPPTVEEPPSEPLSVEERKQLMLGCGIDITSPHQRVVDLARALGRYEATLIASESRYTSVFPALTADD